MRLQRVWNGAVPAVLLTIALTVLFLLVVCVPVAMSAAPQVPDGKGKPIMGGMLTGGRNAKSSEGKKGPGSVLSHVPGTRSVEGSGREVEEEGSAEGYHEEEKEEKETIGNEGEEEEEGEEAAGTEEEEEVEDSVAEQNHDVGVSEPDLEDGIEKDLQQSEKIKSDDDDLSELLLSEEQRRHQSNPQTSSSLFEDLNGRKSNSDKQVIKSGRFYELDLQAGESKRFAVKPPKHHKGGLPRWVILQSRTQQTPLFTCSEDTQDKLAGTSNGLLTYLKGSDWEASMEVKAGKSGARVQIEGRIGYELDPIPGGCCQFCDNEVDPQVKVEYNGAYQHIVSFENGNFGINFGQEPVVCELNPNLVYRLYALRVSVDRDFDENKLFAGYRLMSNVSSIRKHGKYIKKFRNYDHKVVRLNEKSGRAVVYNIIIKDLLTGRESAYSPASSYACNFTAEADSDQSCYQAPPFEQPALYLYVVVGLFLCLFAHAYFGIECFIFGAWWGGIILYVITEKMIYSPLMGFGSAELKLVIVVSGSMMSGFLLFTWYKFFSGFYVPLHFIGTSMGLVLAGCVFASPIGDHRIWTNESCYWTWIAFLTIASPTMVLCFFEEKMLNIFSASLCGSYLLVLAVDLFVGSNMSLIMGRVVNRAAVPGYGRAFSTGMAFGEEDYMLMGMWVMTCLTGMVWQYNVTARHISYFVHINLPHTHHVPLPVEDIRAARRRREGERARNRSGQHNHHVHFQTPPQQSPPLAASAPPLASRPDGDEQSERRPLLSGSSEDPNQRNFSSTTRT
eukprot:Nk52_evm35s2356 gene=Nk52_evmTU35s2356